MASWMAYASLQSRARRLIVVMLLAGLVAFVLAGCAAGANPVADSKGSSAGFWLGLWHGFIAPITFLVSLFNHSVGFYEVHNSGAWYNFGFLIGISAFFSGPAGASGRSRSARKART